nr:carausius neuropeptide-like precursor 1 [Locusta migratoria]
MLLSVAVLLAAACAAANHHAAGGVAPADQYPGPARLKRDPLGFNARGFHDDIFGQDFGIFHTVKRSRSVENVERPLLVGVADSSDKNGRYKREVVALPAMPSTTKAMEFSKRRPEMGSSGFHGDTFSSGFGEFWTMKKKAHVKRDPEVPEPVQYADMWSDEEAVKKSLPTEGFASEELPSRFREEKVLFEPQVSEGGPTRKLLKNKGEWHRIIPATFRIKPYVRGNDDTVIEMLRSRMQTRGDSSLRNAAEQGNSLYEANPEIGETVVQRTELPDGLADLWKTNGNSQEENLQKRRPEMGSSGFHGNMFSNGFGEFWPMKKRSNTLAMYGDADIGKLPPMKRRPEMDSLGFHGDTFHNGFGDFWPMKRFASAENFATVRDEPKMAQNYTHFKECCEDDEKTDLKISVR